MWAPDLVWTFCRDKNLFPCWDEHQTDPAPRLVTTLTELSWFHIIK